MDHMAPCSVGVLPGPSYSPAPMPPDPPPLQVLLVAIDWALEPPWANSDSPVAAVSTYGPRADYHAAFAEALAPGSTSPLLSVTTVLRREDTGIIFSKALDQPTQTSACLCDDALMRAIRTT